MRKITLEEVADMENEIQRLLTREELDSAIPPAVAEEILCGLDEPDRDLAQLGEILRTIKLLPLGSSQRAELESEIERLRGQIAELLPWAAKALDEWEIDNRRYDSEESELLLRISAGEFGEV